MQVGHGRINLCVLQVLLKVCLQMESSHVSTSSMCSSDIAYERIMSPKHTNACVLSVCTHLLVQEACC